MNEAKASAGQAIELAATPPLICPVCRTSSLLFFMKIGIQSYWRCTTCEARFLDPRDRLGQRDEHAFYRTHQNDADDPGYRRFLEKLARPLLGRLAPDSAGLDFGCGAAPALVAILREAGHRVAVYDPLFAPDRAPLARRYDFITCSETAEHFHDPAGEFDRLGEMLRPGGWLAVMTCFQTNDARFANWHYRRDPTHVVFYRAATFGTIAAQRDWSCEIPVKDVALMQKR